MIKPLLITLLFTTCINILTAQNIGINDDGSAPNSNAILDIDVTTNNKGVLLPRITTAQRSGIAGLGMSDEGLMVYDETTTSFWYWSGSEWTEISVVSVGAAAGWETKGNTGTVAGSDFVGTSDAADLDIRTNNVIRVRISQQGQIEYLNTGRSVFLGEKAGENDDLTDNDNVFAGYRSGRANSSGYLNTAVGFESMFSNTNGNSNTVLGSAAMYSNSSGDRNLALGYGSFYSNGNGNENIAVGYETLYSNTTGSRNTAVGYRAHYSNTTGYLNTVMGYEAMRVSNTAYNNIAVGYRSMYNTSTGYNNVSVGYQALLSNVNGYNNTAIGNFSFTNGTTFNNSTALGYNALVTGSAMVRIGNSGVSSIGGFANWTNVSDARFKTSVQENVVGLDFIMNLRPVTYNLDLDAIAKFYNTPDSLRLPETEQLKSAEVQSGFLAQEVEVAAKASNYDFHGVEKPKNAESHYGLRYAEFVVPLVKGMQEQQALIEQQQQLIIDLQNRLEKLEQSSPK